MLSKQREENEDPPRAVLLRCDRILMSPPHVNESLAHVFTCNTAHTTHWTRGHSVGEITYMHTHRYGDVHILTGIMIISSLRSRWGHLIQIVDKARHRAALHAIRWQSK